eukprot:1890835-Prymnesium_polylepis.2
MSSEGPSSGPVCCSSWFYVTTCPLGGHREISRSSGPRVCAGRSQVPVTSCRDVLPYSMLLCTWRAVAQDTWYRLQYVYTNVHLRLRHYAPLAAP